MRRFVAALFMIVFAGCATVGSGPEASDQPESAVQALCDAGRYHEAMRRLPGEMAAWAEYTRRTGSTAEGAAGFLYATTMFRIAGKGDADWGKILDDPGIPYRYKTDLLFEIAEARLGKGAAWSPSHTRVVIIPRENAVNAWKEVTRLLKHVLSDQGDTSDRTP